MRILLLLVTLSIAAAANAQTQPLVVVSKLTLSSTSERTSVRATGMIGPMWCGPDQGVYARVLDATGALGSLPVTLISPKKTVVYSLMNVQGIEPSARADSFVAAGDDSGRVYFVARYLAGTDIREFLVTFSADGSFFGKVPVESSLAAYQLTPLPDGMFFMAGLRETPDHDQQVRASNPFAAIFDRNGRMVKRLDSPTDRAAVRFGENGSMPYNTVAQGGVARLGSDGFLYVLKRSTTPRVQIFSQSGDKIHDFPVWVPFEGAEAGDMITADGRFLIKFYKIGKVRADNKVLWVEYASDSGEPRRALDATELKGQVICSEGDGFRVLTFTPDGYFAIGSANAQ